MPARTLVAGIPGKVVRDLTEAEIVWKGEGTREYQILTKRCLASFREVEALTAPEPGRKRLDLSSVQPLYKLKGG